jgi:hypothetical protein
VNFDLLSQSDSDDNFIKQNSNDESENKIITTLLDNKKKVKING